uniref:(northern house mosquito) hypothetical protein n=1 Tax=Culex pipiens TaxID=7175 RepID=A0A8D8G1H3_CULPI
MTVNLCNLLVQLVIDLHYAGTELDSSKQYVQVYFSTQQTQTRFVEHARAADFLQNFGLILDSRAKVLFLGICDLCVELENDIRNASFAVGDYIHHKYVQVPIGGLQGPQAGDHLEGFISCCSCHP